MTKIDKLLRRFEKRWRLVHARIEPSDQGGYRALCLVWDGRFEWQEFDTEHDDVEAAERYIEDIRQQYPSNETITFNLVPVPVRSTEDLEAV